MEPFHLRRGFTLIELMVVLAIMVVIMGVVLTSQSSFNRTIVLANTAYDIALTLRSAGVYGLGSRVTSSASNAGYGIHVETETSGAFTLFADTYPAIGQSGLCHPQVDSFAPDARPGNCAYEVNQGERVADYTLENAITISNFCAYDGGWSCANGGNVHSLDIVFARPNADPFMSANGSYALSSPVTRACITVSSPQGDSRFISIGESGGITANASSCP
ncbi:MAG: type II secretion system protein [Patescibacteria group bacterium]